MKRTVSLAMITGLATALLLGGAGAAQASGGHQCANGVANVVTCNDTDTVVPVKIEIEGNRTLTDAELSVLEDSLNDIDVDVEAIKLVVVDVYRSFNPSIDITVDDVKVCVVAVCS
ncbi:hypothetical protein [Streptoalloteichus hindustanus]|uniref:Uncharacterized protein n=1 Tax=Streptoalloteichus hindustanus TaxID=2017 RepID=A0A1M4Y639_STRHI|nr:hypothetical protein [Streptoalloteichus hindustanus]SHF01178.1 hypothetical protein SAMN05444320_102250 [Streptoalloteichus hindustanus]